MADHLNSELAAGKTGLKIRFWKNYMMISPVMHCRHNYFSCSSAPNQLQGAADGYVHEDYRKRFPARQGSLFARLTLSDAEYDLYRQIYHHLQPKASLTRPGDLLGRVACYADRTGEAAWQPFRKKHISEDYLWRLTENYIRSSSSLRRRAGDDNQQRKSQFC